ncbi:hypothetical protein THAOC_18181, partial [Thalassiosira oceanica]
MGGTSGPCFLSSGPRFLDPIQTSLLLWLKNGPLPSSSAHPEGPARGPPSSDIATISIAPAVQPDAVSAVGWVLDEADVLARTTTRPPRAGCRATLTNHRQETRGRKGVAAPIVAIVAGRRPTPVPPASRSHRLGSAEVAASLRYKARSAESGGPRTSGRRPESSGPGSSLGRRTRRGAAPHPVEDDAAAAAPHPTMITSKSYTPQRTYGACARGIGVRRRPPRRAGSSRDESHASTGVIERGMLWTRHSVLGFDVGGRVGISRADAVHEELASPAFAVEPRQARAIRAAQAVGLGGRAAVEPARRDVDRARQARRLAGEVGPGPGGGHGLLHRRV